MNIIQVIKACQATTSPTEKVKALKLADGDTRELLRWTYSHTISYGVKFADWDATPDLEHYVELDDILQLLEPLANREVAGNKARERVTDFTEACGNLIPYLVNKDLRCGVSATLINKAWPGLVPQFKIQLAKEVPRQKLKFPMWAQLKYDGVRIVTRVDLNRIAFYTRSGKEVNLPLFARLFRDAPHGIYDGEMILGEGNTESRTGVSGLINSAMKGGSIDESVLSYAVFDMLSLEEMDNQQCSRPYKMRFAELMDCLPKDDQVFHAKTGRVNNFYDVDKLYASQIAKGFEGLILKPIDHLYSFKRSADWVKMKETKDADLKCVNWQEGTGKYAGQIGALVCVGTVEGKSVRVEIGSGLSDADRAEDFSYYRNQTIEVMYNSVIPKHAPHGIEGFTLFLPRFVQVRTDK